MKSLRTLASLAGLFLATATFVIAQEGSTAPKPDAKASPVAETPAEQQKTRSRRVAGNPAVAPEPAGEKAEPAKQAESATKKPTTTETEASEVPKETAEKPDAEQSDDKVVPPAKDSVAPDAITELREQIVAAGTPAEKTRLQLQLAEKLVTNGAKQEAIDELHRAIAEERFDPQGFYNVGNALARLGDSEGAVTAYRKAIDQKKGRYSRALNNLGVIQLRQGLWDQAYETFIAALRLESFRYAEASYNLGRLYAARGETDLALREWRRAVSVNPEHTAAKQALAGSANFNRVAVATTSAPRKPVENRTAPVVEPVPAPAAAPVAKSSSPKATKLRPITHTVDRQTYGYLQAARTSRERNRHEEAIANYQKVISKMGGYFAPANLELSYVLITLNRDDEAMAALMPVTQQDGARYPISYYHLARLYETRGELKVAEENFARSAAYYKQDNPQMLLDLSRVREKLGDVQGALTALEEYVALMNQRNLKPDWSDARLAALRGKLAAATPKE